MLGFTNIVGNLSPLPELVLWRDPVARSGEEAMAVDEALLEWGRKPVLRAYRWAEPTVTYGYFDEEATARAIFPGEELHFVRRWTGGIVDHRQDIPFTLAMHRKGEKERPSSAVLYRWIHGALARVLRDCGVECVMLDGDAPDGGRACFSSPVTSDLVFPGGENWLAAAREESAEAFFTRGASRIVFSLPDGMNCWLPAWRKSIPCAWTRNCSPA